MNYMTSYTIKSKAWINHTKLSLSTHFLTVFVQLPTQLYGQFLLSFAILLSCLSSVYLKTVYREYMSILQSSQHYYEILEETQYRLQAEHDSLFSITRLQSFSKNLNLVAPDINHTRSLLTL